MNPSHREGWSTPAASEASGVPQSSEQSQRPRPTLFSPFGQSTPNNHPQPVPGVPPLPPTLGGPHYPFTQNHGQNLPNLSSYPQTSPSQLGQRPAAMKTEPHHVSHAFQMSPQRNAYAPQALGQSAPQTLGQSQVSTDWEHGNQQRRDREDHRQHEEIIKREQQDQDLRDMHQSEQVPPHQNHTGSIHLHQPVAVGPQVRSAIHGPNGLLANSAPNVSTNASASLGVPTGPASIFASVPSQADDTLRQNMHQSDAMQQALPSQMGAPAGMPQIPGPALAQGQQPILNDALSYLDQVKVQFVQHPDVYNRFLDIMKDFKGQVIDTPGVIERVSHLFAGNPNLIQGFNTFLPPGYHIECGAGDEIRVTTPMGTTVNAMPTNTGPSFVTENGNPPGPWHFLDTLGRNSHLSWQNPAGNMSSDGLISPGARPTDQLPLQQEPGSLQPHTSPMATQAQRDQQASDAAAMAHQREQRGVSQLQSAVSAAAHGPLTIPSFPQMSPPGGSATPLPGAMLNGIGSSLTPGAQIGLEKRGPVEFNHAINYVNKIKNRFSNQPEIYKQFLEILQTYQRESKPIQDVYAQVTLLFSSAPDLLEDFKQFLPESAAQHKLAQAKQALEDATMLNSVRGENGYQAAQPPQILQTPRPEARLPPVGNFAPTPTISKDNKRKRGDRQGTAPNSSAFGSSVNPEPNSTAGLRAGQNSNGNKRQKQSQHPVKQPTQVDAPAVSPTLTPSLPEPMPPTSSTLSASPDEIAFFERVKKFIGNKNTMNEFLKLCNLFSHDLIDKNVLVARASSFIGGNDELMTWFKRFMGWTGKEQVIVNKARPSSGKVMLSKCRGLGPSYRLLPKDERSKSCSGRDELCNAVLNDEWASHPTWASEDSGFIAHRKNPHEEGLHRIEEERHDYDFNIEVAERTIQLLEPVAQQLKMMSREEKLAFTLTPGFGGQSETIYKRAIMKLYGRAAGQQVIDALFIRPFQVIPTVLFRCKQKVEEWKASQREWEKVWREQTQKMFWKSLDHQGISARQADKRQFQTKTLQNEIQVRYEEQKRQRHISRITPPNHQFEFTFDDPEVIMDASHLLLTYAETVYAADHPKLSTFIKELIPLFFGLDSERFQQRVKDVNNTPPTTYADDEAIGPDEGTSNRSRKFNGKRNDLLRGVLERGRNGRAVKKGNLDSVASSRASTPEPLPNLDEDMIGGTESPGRESITVEDGTPRWLDHPQAGDLKNSRDIAPDTPYRRDTFNMYCNLPIYCFFRMFIILYERLFNLKQNEDEVHEAVRRAKTAKPALELRMIDKEPGDFFADTSPIANYYSQILTMFEDHIKDDHNPDMNHIEETLRRFYLQNGWQMYSFDKMLGALARFGIAVLGNDGKDKSWEILQLFKKDRVKEETTHQDELHYRKAVEKYAKDGDIYRIAYNQSSMNAQVQIFRKDDPTFNTSNLSPESKWSIYISSYTTMLPTEGVPRSRIRLPLVKRCLTLSPFYSRTEKANDEDPSSTLGTVATGGEGFQGIKSLENLGIRIAVETYRMHAVNDVDTAKEWWIQSDKVRFGEKRELVKGLERMKEVRDNGFREKMVENNEWMRGRSKGEVDRLKEEFREWVTEGKIPGSWNGYARAGREDDEMVDA